MMGGRAYSVGITIVALLLGACASRKVEAPPPAVAAPAEPRPLPPAGMAGLTVPQRSADGTYLTINQGIGAEQAIWHVRAALNVAALSCRGAHEASLVASYNQLLDRQKDVFKKAYAAEQARQRALAGGDWQSRADSFATRLYNFFAQPAARTGFCDAASTVAAEALTVSTGEFRDFSVAALPRLEAPFIAVYRQADAYQQALAAWTSRQTTRPAAPVMAVRPAGVATASAAPTAPPIRHGAMSVQPVAALPVVTAAKPVAGNGWRVQIGAFANSDAAQAAWSTARSRIGELAVLQPSYVPVPERKLIRLQAGPVRDRAAANALCTVVSATGQGCIPVAPPL